LRCLSIQPLVDARIHSIMVSSYNGMVQDELPGLFKSQSCAKCNLNCPFAIDEIFGGMGVSVHHHLRPGLNCHLHYMAVGYVMAGAGCYLQTDVVVPGHLRRLQGHEPGM